MNQLPTPARMVATLYEPMNRDQLFAAGYTAEDITAAEKANFITRKRVSNKVLYTPTYNGRRQYSELKAEQVIAYSRATSGIATPPSAPSRDPWAPPKWEPARPGAMDYQDIPSKGL